MPENQNNVEETFGKTDFLYSITQGFVLVKKSIFGQRWSVGTYTEKPFRRVVTLKLHDPSVSIDYLKKILSKKGDQLKDSQKQALENEIAFREGTMAETPKMIKATLRLSGTDVVIQRRIKAKTGIQIRWPWQSALVLHLGERQIDTPPINIDVTEKIRIQADTDYRYKIVNPDVYVEAYEQQGSHAKIASLIGQKLDTIMREYFKDQPIDDILKISSMGLKEKYEFELAKIGNDYGVEITNFFIKKVELPEEIIKAQAKEASANAEKVARIKAAEAEAESIGLRGEAEAKSAALRVEKILETLNKNDDFAALDGNLKMQLARTIVAAQTPNATIIDGGFANNGNADMSILLATLLGKQNKQDSDVPYVPLQSTDNLSDDEKKQHINEICDTLSLIDEEGYFSSADSKYIVQKRGDTYQPGTVISINDVTLDEVQDLALKKQNEKKKTKK